MTVGILGGAFDPPHVGHVALARAASSTSGSSAARRASSPIPAHKDVDTPPEIRLCARRARVRGRLDEAEVALDPFARTVDSLEALGLDDPVFLVGADEFADFPTWKEPERVLELARLGGRDAARADRSRLDAVLAALDTPDRVEFFEIEPLAVSSSEIRDRVARGRADRRSCRPPSPRRSPRLGLYRRR